MTPTLPIWKRLLFAGLCFAAFLALLEGALALAPVVMQRSRGTVASGPESASVVVYCVGDSVTFGTGVGVQRSYPWQLSERLATAGLTDTRVMMIASPGATSAELRSSVIPKLEALPSGQRPVVYALYGHNDFLQWELKNAKSAFKGLDIPADPRDDGSLRILRLLRWFQTAAASTAPNVKINARNVASLEEGLRKLAQLTRARGGDLFTLTYTVPPEPPASLPTETADYIRATHVGQPLINAKLREIAAGLGVELIDLEHRIDTGTEWSTTWWVDNIHLTARGLSIVADQIQWHLRASGLLAGPRPGAEG